MTPEDIKRWNEMLSIDWIEEVEEEVRRLDDILISCHDSRTLMVTMPEHDPKTWRVR